jgi:MOSC domain-containing protein YiiM
MIGNVVSINIKSKVEGERGIPKHRIDVAEITKTGVSTDFNLYRYEEKQNTENRAVLIYTTDLIEQLNNEGWPINIGDLGENLTISDIKYSELDIGDQLTSGDVVLEISEICNPCNNLSVLSYVGKERITEFMKTIKGRRGWYAKVIEEGTINIDDKIALSKTRN